MADSIASEGSRTHFATDLALALKLKGFCFTLGLELFKMTRTCFMTTQFSYSASSSMSSLASACANEHKKLNASSSSLSGDSLTMRVRISAAEEGKNAMKIF